MNTGDTHIKRQAEDDGLPYDGPERRRDWHQWRNDVDQRLDDGAKTMKDMRAEVAANTAITQNVQTNTSEVVALLNSFKGAFSLLEKLGKLAKWIGYIAGCLTAVAALVAILKGGGSPK